MGTSVYTRICEDCGVVMENVGATRRFCPACLAKRSLEKARNADRAKRAEWKEWEAQRRVEQELRKGVSAPSEADRREQHPGCQ